MVEHAVYEIKFSLWGAASSNQDLYLFPNYTTGSTSSTFYMVFQNVNNTPALAYSAGNYEKFTCDIVNGSYGWDPVGKITIYNTRAAKKIRVECGDTTSIYQANGYWTSGSGFTNTSGTAIVYDTTTQWTNVGRFANITNCSNWAVWVRRIG